MQLARPLFPLLAFGALLLAGACGSNAPGSDSQASHGPDGGTIGSSGDDGGALFAPTTLGDGGVTASTVPRCIVATQQCVNTCPGGGGTTVTGTVYDPGGEESALQHCRVHPELAAAAITPGATCYSCSASTRATPSPPRLRTPTAAFLIHDVPDGPNIPLVLQVGKWRRQFTLPNVRRACEDNPQPDGDAQLAERTTRRRHSQYRDLDRGRRLARVPISPHRASTRASTGAAPTAVRAASISSKARAARPTRETRRVTNAAANTVLPGPRSRTLDVRHRHSSVANGLAATRRGQRTAHSRTPAPGAIRLRANGGRVFASHFHYAWFDSGPFGQANLATWTPGAESYLVYPIHDAPS